MRLRWDHAVVAAADEILLRIDRSGVIHEALNANITILFP